jgi:glycosyltransferase involved in cell wall biosynthesis
MRRADRLLAISRFVAASAVEQGYRPERVVVALNALAPHDAAATGISTTDDRAAICRELEIDDAAVLLCIVARINEWKGHDLLLRAFAIAIEQVPDAILLVVGQDDGQRATLEQLANSLGITSRVRFTGFRADAHRFVAACDVFVMPSVEEPFGLVFLEAMALGRPVVATNDGGTPEVVVDGVTGLLSAQGDVDALADHLVRLAADPTLRARLGAAGVARVATAFQPERLAADVAAIYCDAAS